MEMMVRYGHSSIQSLPVSTYLCPSILTQPGCPQVEHPTGRTGWPMPCLQYTQDSLLQRFLFNANQSEQTLHILGMPGLGSHLPGQVGTKQACGDRAAIHIPAVGHLLLETWWVLLHWSRREERG